MFPTWYSVLLYQWLVASMNAEPKHFFQKLTQSCPSTAHMTDGRLTLTGRWTVPLKERTVCQQRILLVWCNVQPLVTYQFYLVLPLTKQKPLFSSLGSHCLVFTLSKFAIYRSCSLQLLLRSEDCMWEFTRASYLGTFLFFFSFFFFLRKFIL